MNIGDSVTTASRGVLVQKLLEGLWQTDPKFLPGRRTIVIIDPRDASNYLGPKWAVEAVLEAELASKNG